MGSIRFTHEDHIAIVVLDYPQKRNAVDAEMRDGMTAAYEEIESNDDIRVAILVGEGDRAFCSGGYIDGYLEDKAIGPGGTGPTPVPKPWPASKPFIAAIRGYAVGGGFPLALACDLRIVGRGACLGPSGHKMGVIQGSQQTQRLVRLIGVSRAVELLFLSKYVDGEEAAEIGLAQAVVDDHKVMDKAMEWAQTIASFDPWVVAGTKRLVYEGSHMPLGEALAWEAEIAAEAYRRPQALDRFTGFADRPAKDSE